MSASESTKFQVNFKSPDGTLVNLYAANKEELESLLTAAQDFSALISSVSKSLSGNGNAAAVSNSGYQQSAPVTPRELAQQYAPAPAGDAPSCSHGPMTFIKGVNARGPWSGYKCNGPTGTTKCKTIFNRG